MSLLKRLQRASRLQVAITNDASEGALGMMKQQLRKAPALRNDVAATRIKWRVNDTQGAINRGELASDVFNQAIPAGRQAQKFTKKDQRVMFAKQNALRDAATVALKEARDQKRSNMEQVLRRLRPCLTVADVETCESTQSEFSQELQPLNRLKQQWKHQKQVRHPNEKNFPHTSSMTKALLLDLLKQVVVWDFSAPFLYTAPVVGVPAAAGEPLVPAAATTITRFSSPSEVDAFMQSCGNKATLEKGIKAQLHHHKISTRKLRGQPKLTLDELASMLKSKLQEVSAAPTDMEVDAEQQPLEQGTGQHSTGEGEQQQRAGEGQEGTGEGQEGTGEGEEQQRAGEGQEGEGEGEQQQRAGEGHQGAGEGEQGEQGAVEMEIPCELDERTTEPSTTSAATAAAVTPRRSPRARPPKRARSTETESPSLQPMTRRQRQLLEATELAWARARR